MNHLVGPRGRLAILAAVALLAPMLAGCTSSEPKIPTMSLDELAVALPWPTGQVRVEGTITEVEAFDTSLGPMNRLTLEAATVPPVPSPAFQAQYGAEAAKKTGPGQYLQGVHLTVLANASLGYNVGDRYSEVLDFEQVRLQGRSAIAAREMAVVTDMAWAQEQIFEVAGSARWASLRYQGVTAEGLAAYGVTITRDMNGYGVPMEDIVIERFHPGSGDSNATLSMGWSAFWFDVFEEGSNIVETDETVTPADVTTLLPDGITRDWIEVVDENANALFDDGDRVLVAFDDASNDYGTVMIRIKDTFSSNRATVLLTYGPDGPLVYQEPANRITKVRIVEGADDKWSRVQILGTTGVLPLNENATITVFSEDLFGGDNVLASARLQPGTYPVGQFAYVYHDNNANLRIDAGDYIDVGGRYVNLEIGIKVAWDRGSLRLHWLGGAGVFLADVGSISLLAQEGQPDRAVVTMDEPSRVFELDQPIKIAVHAKNGTLLFEDDFGAGTLGNTTLGAELMFDDVDDNGRVSDGDLLVLNGPVGTEVRVTISFLDEYYHVYTTLRV